MLAVALALGGMPNQETKVVDGRCGRLKIDQPVSLVEEALNPSAFKSGSVG